MTWADRQRRYISQRVTFHALEAEIMASFERAEILSRYYELNGKAEAQFDLVQSMGLVNKADYEPLQDAFLKMRKEMLGLMIAEMRLLS